MREDCSGRRYRSGRPWGRLTLHGFFQYGAQTEKLQQQLASEKGVHPEVRFHVPRSGRQVPGDYLALQRRQATSRQSFSAFHPHWPMAQQISAYLRPEWGRDQDLVQGHPESHCLGLELGSLPVPKARASRVPDWEPLILAEPASRLPHAGLWKQAS